MLNASTAAMSASRSSLLPADGANRLSELLLHDATFDHALEQIAYEIRELSGFPLIKIQLYDPVRGKILDKGSWGAPASAALIHESAADAVPFAEVIRNGEPLARFGDSAAVIWGDQPVQTLICAPIQSDSGLLGVLSMGSPEAVLIDTSTFARAKSFGRLVAVMVERKEAQPLREAERLLQAVLDSLSARVAILDDSGTIILVNEAWRHFASESEVPDREGYLGINYLQVCDVATGDWSEEAPPVAAGIRDVIASREVDFTASIPVTARRKNAGSPCGRRASNGTDRCA